MTTALSNSRAPRPQHEQNKEVLRGLVMLSEAYRDKDQFRIEAAMRHLIFLHNIRKSLAVHAPVSHKESGSAAE